MGLYAYPYEMPANLIVSGEDAADFLQSQFSNDLRPFSVGQCTYGLWLDVKGKILADSWVLCLGEERFWIFSEYCEGQIILKNLEKHIIADDVELELGPSLKALALMGERVGELCFESNKKLSGFIGRRSILSSYELIFPDQASRRAWTCEHGCELVSESWLLNERIKAGLPQVGAEVLPGDLPAEAGLVEDAVSLTKGCFLGQEVVARMHNVGRPQRKLYLLSGVGGPPDVPSSVMNEAGKSLGEIRSSIAEDSGWKGVAMLKSRFVTSGSQVAVGERPAKVESFYSGHF